MGAVVVILTSKVKEEHFSVPLAAVGNGFDASRSLAMVTHSPETIDDTAKQPSFLSLKCCNECALTSFCIANNKEGLSSGEREGLLDGFFKICSG